MGEGCPCPIAHDVAGTTMIELRSLSKRFGPVSGGILAVDNVTLKVPVGEVLGFLGPNGAGKSTTMKMITGFLTPTAGNAVVCGHDVALKPLEVKSKIGYLPEGAPAYPDMTPEAFLRFIAAVRGLHGAAAEKRIAEVVERVQLAGVYRQPIETLSKGFKRRVGLAQAILHDPQVLILDEPTDGLDPNQKHEVRALIREMAGKKAIILSTHILEEVEAVCTRAVIIAKGRVVADGTPHQLQSRSRYHNAVVVSVRLGHGASKDTIRQGFEQLRGIAGVEPEPVTDGHYRCVLLPKNGEQLVPEITQLARTRAWEIDELRVEHGRLDEVFRDITTRA